MELGLVSAAGPVVLGLTWGWLGGMIARTASRDRALTFGLASTALLILEAAAVADARAGGRVAAGVVAGLVLYRVWVGWLRHRS